MNIKKANWLKFKESITKDMEKLNTEDNGRITRQIIDQKINKWHNIVLKAAKESIPEEEIKILPHPKDTEKQKQLQFRYNILKNLSNRYGWSLQLRTVIRILRDELIEESRNNMNKNWEQLIQGIEIKYNEPKVFWAGIRRLMGGRQEVIPYLKDERGNKIY